MIKNTPESAKKHYLPFVFCRTLPEKTLVLFSLEEISRVGSSIFISMEYQDNNTFYITHNVVSADILLSNLLLKVTSNYASVLVHCAHIVCTHCIIIFMHATCHLIQ